MVMRVRSLGGRMPNTSQHRPKLDVRFGLLQRFLAFTGVGAVGTLAHYLMLLLLVEGLGRGPNAGTAVGFIVGAVVNYSLNYKFTFRSDARHRVALPKFLTIAVVGFCINAVIMRLGITWLAFHYMLVQLFATGVVLIWNFAGNLLWTFRESHRGQ